MGMRHLWLLSLMWSLVSSMQLKAASPAAAAAAGATWVTTPATFMSALVNSSVAVINLRANVALRASDWQGDTTLQLRRNLTIRSDTESSEGAEYMLHLAFAEDTLRLDPGVELTFQSLVVVGMSIRPAAYGALVIHSRGGVLTYDHVTMITALCTPQREAIVEMLASVPRASGFAGRQSLHNLGRTCIRQDGGRCFEGGIFFTSLAMEIPVAAVKGEEQLWADAGSLRAQGGFVYHSINCTVLCERQVTTACLQRLSYDACFSQEMLAAVTQYHRSTLVVVPRDHTLGVLAGVAMVGLSLASMWILSAGPLASVPVLPCVAEVRSSAPSRRASSGTAEVFGAGAGLLGYAPNTNTSLPRLSTTSQEALSQRLMMTTSMSLNTVHSSSSCVTRHHSVTHAVDPNPDPHTRAEAPRTLGRLSTGGQFLVEPVTSSCPDDIQLGVLLGAGSYGKVYKGVWQDCMVAVKVITVEAGVADQIHNEVALSLSLDHPNVVRTLHSTSSITSGAPRSGGLPTFCPAGISMPAAVEEFNGSVMDTMSHVWPVSPAEGAHYNGFSTIVGSGELQHQGEQQVSAECAPAPRSVPSRTSASGLRHSPVRPSSSSALDTAFIASEAAGQAGLLTSTCYSSGTAYADADAPTANHWPLLEGGDLGDTQEGNLGAWSEMPLGDGEFIDEGVAAALLAAGPAPPCTSPSQTWIVLELCSRGALSDASVPRASDGTVSQHWTLLRAINVASGMAYLHGQPLSIIHGDLKSSNVLLAADPRDPFGCVAKVADLGLSKTLSAERTHMSTRSLGTVTHAAPELLMTGRLGTAADVYSFGVLMWELAVGQIAFRGLSHGQVLAHVLMKNARPAFPPHIPAPYVALACECWALDVARRPAFPQVLERLQAMLEALMAMRRSTGRQTTTSGRTITLSRAPSTVTLVKRPSE